MTAEVAILNKSGIAVAADSAVTRGRNKVHISANKIFQLHKTLPVGILVYNFADVFGLPWELVAKTYREQLHDRPFGTLKEICDDFLSFVQSPIFLTEQAQESDLLHIGMFLLDRLSDGVPINASRRNRDLRTNMESYLGRPEKTPLDGHAAEYSLTKFQRRYGALCRLLCNEAPNDLRMSAANKALFVKCMHDFIIHEMKSDYHTGFAVFGYGTTELLPSLCHLVVDGAPLGHLRILDKNERNIDRLPSKNASIMAFAQSDAASLFMDGISPDLRRFFMRAISKSLNGFSKKIFDEIKPITSDKDAALVSEHIISREIKNFLDNFEKEVSRYIHSAYVRPVVTSIDGLGKDDMANLAESIVELAAIKKKVSPQIETVGGPIDVAVVSKNDGFVWIKRKYYFDINLNRAFYDRYYDKKFTLEHGR